MAASHLLDEQEDDTPNGGYHMMVTIEDGSRPQTTPTGRPHPSPVTSSGDQVDDSKSTRLARGFSKALRKNQDYIRIPVSRSIDSLLPAEWWKTGIAFIWAAFNLVLTTVMITVVHERVPDKSISPPLPDKFFDYVPRFEWAFSVTEVNGMILVALWFIQWLFLKHRAIVGRRFFFLQGMLYLYRMVTMYITTLPVPSMHMHCAPKLYGDSQGKIKRVLQLVSGGGLSITGSHLMCGDFLYSGHTVMLTLTFLFIQEYSPRSLLWRCYHVICWFLSAMGVIFILIAHEHYSLDVVVAYFITSRLFYWYHTMANNRTLRGSPHNYLSRIWWNRVFNFLEKNVKTTVPCSFSWPLLPPSAVFKNPCKSYSIVQSAQD
ncbi:phosphatidylcholine:ceramide cholinephosphotransferase 2-like [Carassius auratus]|uniref:Phosphatidylcholine:ceramide cholinephosphotransferase 2-like n=1 Tax=Carassius auratus TaxID=7957 RepID=A0A6P6M931_CARAU|nr:phosphatidylcholine:ceramide cholinephosphotransferase 2-like [Carassius auratus]XP_026093100.1 phosphatidylcholine:ceramide cholinephosphotransferase 2-like [Carassius auratus]XP_026093101.1 phosphatidylcholine:ceramide cholinephosphotransferase 2-like [Carassius auratus]XP_026093102.1 phosphatidylcholine:ceramide cholinephosphotransferase 2-like [Carassius auratus]XP_026093103.1 phosphatidylcholine:ceramide cholinephosphotransferase 2-like [Carassius auratus]XP_026093104.1 phosphatidylcho